MVIIAGKCGEVLINRDVFVLTVPGKRRWVHQRLRIAPRKRQRLAAHRRRRLGPRHSPRGGRGHCGRRPRLEAFPTTRAALSRRVADWQRGERKQINIT
ncbi:unnamed protein product [Lampetra planeri]